MDLSSVVYTRALSGTETNPGLPNTLATIVTGQSQHESANYTSPVFLASNNAFGYKYSGSKYQRGNYHGYAKYDSLDDSTAEMVDYIYRRTRDGSFPADLTTITDPGQYATLLQNAAIGPYFEDSQSNYAGGIASYLSNEVLSVTDQVANNPGMALVVFAALLTGGYWLTKN